MSDLDQQLQDTMAWATMRQIILHVLPLLDDKAVPGGPAIKARVAELAEQWVPGCAPLSLKVRSVLLHDHEQHAAIRAKLIEITGKERTNTLTMLEDLLRLVTELKAVVNSDQHA